MRGSPLLLLACTALPSFAQTPITDARQLAVGATVTVRGIVTNGPEFGSIRFMQDATGGIALFPGTGSIGGFAPLRGADLTVTGTVAVYNGLLQLDPINAFTVHSDGNPMPAPLPLSPVQIGESNEGRLVRVNDCVFSDAGDAFESGAWVFMSDGQLGTLYLHEGHALTGTTVPFSAVDIVALVSQYSTDTPPAGGYQLRPRDSADIFPAGGIAITDDAEQSDIVPDGFTLHWGTNVPGSSEAAFGLTPALGSFTAAPGTATVHAVTLTGLEAATFYYARPFSVEGSDTAWASLGIYSTASSVPGDIRVYFTLPVDNTVSLGTPAVHLDNTVDDTIRTYISAAQHTIEYAVYNTTNTPVVAALNYAADQGVQVRVIAEGSNSNSALDGLDPAIPVLYRENSLGSGMHNKFIVIDADDAPNAHLLTGSTNCTNQSFYEDANNLVIVDDQALARCYRAEFNEMWGSDGAQPNEANSRFGSAKLDDTPHLFNVGGTMVESSFSPSDGTTGRIDAALRTADDNIEFALFSFTMGSLANTLIGMEAEPGVTVRGLLESSNMDEGTYEELLDGGVNVLADNMSGAYLHHKYAIVDRANMDSDPQAITGSHNWSYNAETHNDENTLIIHSATVADQFHQEWYARWNHAVGVEENASAILRVAAWPNPAQEQLNIAFAAGQGGRIVMHITDATGRTVRSEQRPANSGTNTWIIPTRDLAPGSYLLTLDQDGRRTHLGFVRQ